MSDTPDADKILDNSIKTAISRVKDRYAKPEFYKSLGPEVTQALESMLKDSLGIGMGMAKALNEMMLGRINREDLIEFLDIFKRLSEYEVGQRAIRSYGAVFRNSDFPMPKVERVLAQLRSIASEDVPVKDLNLQKSLAFERVWKSQIGAMVLKDSVADIESKKSLAKFFYEEGIKRGEGIESVYDNMS